MCPLFFCAFIFCCESNGFVVKYVRINLSEMAVDFMRLKNILIIVKDIEKSKAFYRDLFGLSVAVDMGENVILTEGLVLQERTLWEKSTGLVVTEKSHNALLYFEERDMESFLAKLEKSAYDIQYVHSVREEYGKKVVRIYDLDGHIIEVKG